MLGVGGGGCVVTGYRDAHVHMLIMELLIVLNRT